MINIPFKDCEKVKDEIIALNNGEDLDEVGWAYLQMHLAVCENNCKKLLNEDAWNLILYKQGGD